jgi:hypothetical protein
MIAAVTRLQFLTVVGHQKCNSPNAADHACHGSRRRSRPCRDWSMRQRAPQSATRSQRDAPWTRPRCPVRHARHPAQAKTVHVIAGPFTLTRQLGSLARQTAGRRCSARRRSGVQRDNIIVGCRRVICSIRSNWARPSRQAYTAAAAHARAKRMATNGLIRRHSCITDGALVAAVPKPASGE